MNKDIVKCICFFIVINAIVGCYSSRYVKPLAKKQISVGADFGGPIIVFAGAPIPIPFTSIFAGYGIDSTLTIHGGLHTTSMAFGNAQIDLGITKQILTQKNLRPAISISPSLYYIRAIDTVVQNLFPQVDIHAYWSAKNKPRYFFMSFANAFDVKIKKAFGEKNANIWMPSLLIGHVWERKHFNYQLEYKWQNLLARNKDIVVDYFQKRITPNGASGLYFSVCYKF